MPGRNAYALLAATMTSVLLVHTLSAQTCQGTASYAHGPIRVGAGLDIGDKMKSYGVQVGGGSAIGPFADASVSRVEYDNVDGSGTAFGVSAGYAINLTSAKTAQFCPLAGFAYQSGPSIPTIFGPLETSAHAIAFGGSFGGIAMSTPTFAFVPFAGAQFVDSKVTGKLAGNSASDSQNYGEITAGAGFVVNQKLTVQPSASIPVGLKNGKASFSLAIAFNFGNAN